MPIQRIAIRLAASTLLLLGACGGSDDGTDNGVTPPPAMHSIGGSVTGLVGSVTLQDNGSDSLTLTSNGNFSFTTRIAAGSNYAVTVSSQPSGPDCVVTNGSGIATADVANVTVTCSVSPATRFVPLSASLAGSGDPAGLYVFTTKNIERAPVRVTDAPMEEIAVVAEQTISANATVTGARPATLIYRTIGASDGDHLWALDLRGGSNLVPRQIGSLAFRDYDGTSSAVLTLCGATLMLRKLDDPDSAFLLVRVTTETQGGCSEPRTILVRASDSPTSTVREVPAAGGNLQPLYHPDGTLAGIVGFDPASQAIVFFDDESFATARPLFAAPAFFQSIRDGTYSSWSESSWTDLAGPQTSATIAVDDGDGSMLYRIDYNGTANLLYDLSSVVDYPSRFGANMYVLDRDLSSPATIMSMMRIPVDGSAPQSLLSYPFDPEACNGYDSPVGPLGQRFIVVRICWDEVLGATSHILSLPETSLGAPITIASYPDLIYNVSVAEDRVLVSFSSESASSTPPTLYRWDNSTEVLDSTGTIVLPKAPSAFVSFHGDPADSLLQARDFTGPGFQGGALYKLTLGSPAAPTVSQLSYPDGTPALLPVNTEDGSGMAIAPNLVYGIFFDLDDVETSMVVDLERGRAMKLVAPDVSLRLISFLNY